MKMKLLIYIYGLLISPLVLSLDKESAKDRKCIVDPPLVKNLDWNWPDGDLKASVTLEGGKVSVRLGRLDLIRIVSELKGDPASEIRKDELYYDSCLTFKWVGNTSVLHGFNGKTGGLDLTYIDINDHTFKLVPKHSKTGGRIFVSLTDNYSYVFYISCWDDDEAGWSIGSTSDTLDCKTVEYIKNYAKSLGFSEKYFTRLSYETCGGSSSKYEQTVGKYLPQATRFYEAHKRSGKFRSTDHFRSRYPAGPHTGIDWIGWAGCNFIQVISIAHTK